MMMASLPKASRPADYMRLLELRAPFEFAALLPAAPWLLGAPRGDQRPVVLLPGFGAGGASMTPLAAYLRWLNYRTFDWGLGSNRGDVEEDIERFTARVEQLYDQLGGQPLSLVGWSLGGVIAREAARLCPDQVCEVITMGTPVVGGPKYTAVGDFFAAAKGINLDELELEVHARNQLGLQQPITAIYSKQDGVVGWQAAIDVYNEQTKHVQVTGSHVGLGVNPRVWSIVANTLAGRSK